MIIESCNHLLGAEVPVEQAQECARNLSNRYGRAQTAAYLGVSYNTLSQWCLGRPGYGPSRAMATWLLAACRMSEKDLDELIMLRVPRSSRRKR